MRKSPADRKGVIRLLAPLAWILLILSLYNAYLSWSGSAIHKDLYASDSLYIPSMVTDIAEGVPISGWTTSPATYVFPDLPLYAISYFVTRNLHVALALYGVLQCLLFVVSLLVLARLVNPGRPLVRIFTLVICSWCFLFFAVTVGTGDYVTICSIFRRILQTGFHFGATLMAVLCLSWTIRLAQRPRPPGYRFWMELVSLVLITGATVASDALFQVQYVIPMVVVLGITSLLFRTFRTNCMLLASGTACAVWVSRGMEKFLWPNQCITNYLEVLLEQWQWYAVAILKTINTALAEPAGILRIVVILFVLSAITRMISILRKKGPDRDRHLGQWMVLLYWAGMTGSTVLILALTANLTLRYLIPVILFPIVLWPFILPCPEQRQDAVPGRGPTLVALALTIGITALLPSLRYAKDLGRLADYYPGRVREIDEAASRWGVTCGIGAYRYARPITMLSRTGLHIMQTDSDFGPGHWINNREWFRRRVQFLIVDRHSGYDRNDIIEIFGVPRGEEHLSDGYLMIYGRPQDTVLATLFERHPLFMDFGIDGATHSYLPAHYIAEVGRIDGTSRSIAEGESGRGYIATSPVYELPPGTYEVAIRYDSQPDTGTWRLLVKDASGHDVSERILIAPGKDAVFTHMITLDSASRLEVRVHRSGTGALAVHEVTVTRKR